eukprot:m.348656 g.348656  ORF g.348656 m.348656 type:complete len:189 (+) comp16563_c2_seq3:8905-9471(+)
MFLLFLHLAALCSMQDGLSSFTSAIIGKPVSLAAENVACAEVSVVHSKPRTETMEDDGFRWAPENAMRVFPSTLAETVTDWTPPPLDPQTDYESSVFWRLRDRADIFLRHAYHQWKKQQRRRHSCSSGKFQSHDLTLRCVAGLVEMWTWLSAVHLPSLHNVLESSDTTTSFYHQARLLDAFNHCVQGT